MRIRIRFGGASKRRGPSRAARRTASVTAALLTPAAVMALALACWGFAAQMNWTGGFAISTGLFSHWPVWLATAAALQLGSRILYRYSRKGAAPAQ